MSDLINILINKEKRSCIDLDIQNSKVFSSSYISHNYLLQIIALIYSNSDDKAVNTSKL